MPGPTGCVHQAVFDTGGVEVGTAQAVHYPFSYLHQHVQMLLRNVLSRCMIPAEATITHNFLFALLAVISQECRCMRIHNGSLQSASCLDTIEPSHLSATITMCSGDLCVLKNPDLICLSGLAGCSARRRLNQTGKISVLNFECDALFTKYVLHCDHHVRLRFEPFSCSSCSSQPVCSLPVAASPVLVVAAKFRALAPDDA